MSPLAQSSPRKRPSIDEIKDLARTLDKAYTRLRERARAEWESQHRRNDPADACVSVRITAAKKAYDVTAREKIPRVKNRAARSRRLR